MGAESSSGFQSDMSELKVAVLCGGISEERQVSIESGNCVGRALKEAGLEVIISDLGPDKLEILDGDEIDIFFPAFHGRFGEDGGLQQILEDRQFLYAGSGPAASKLAFDKVAAKKVFVEAGIKTPAGFEFERNTTIESFKEQLAGVEKFVVKPIRQGSSIGVSIVDGPDGAIASAKETLGKFGDCMVEEFIPGRDVTAGILCGRVLPLIEIKAERSFFDYQAKYSDEQTQYLFDTIEGPGLKAEIETAAIKCFDAIGCRDFARADFILGDDGCIYVLEVNTIPGLTGHSLLPQAAAKDGLSMSDLCMKIIEAAIRNRKTSSIY